MMADFLGQDQWVPCCRVQSVLAESALEPSMVGASLAERQGSANGASISGGSLYGAGAGDAAVRAARQGSLELRDVTFSYPLRPNTTGTTTALSNGSTWAHDLPSDNSH